MSTYTDLHNKLKDTIAVSCSNRVSTQAVKLSNELNEYWGTFRGTVDFNGSTITSASLSDVTIVNSMLCGSIRTPYGDITLDQLIPAVNELSTKLYGDNFNGDINKLCSQIEFLSGEISAVSSTVIDELSSPISAACLSVSQKLDEFSARLGKMATSFELSVSQEATSRKSVDENLLSGLNDEAAKRGQIDEQLCAMIQKGGGGSGDANALCAEVRTISVMLSGEISSVTSALNSTSVYILDQVSAISSSIRDNDISATSAYTIDQLSVTSAYTIEQVSAVSCNLTSTISAVSSAVSCGLTSMISAISCDLTSVISAISSQITSEVSYISSALETTFGNSLCAVSCSLSTSLTSEVSSVSSEITSQVSAISCSIRDNDISATSAYIIGQLSATSAYTIEQISATSSYVMSQMSALSAALSNEVSSLSLELSVASALITCDVSAISSELKSDLCAVSCSLSTDISVVSAAVDAIETGIAEAAQYKGTLASTDTESLSAIFSENGYSKLLKGYIYHASADQEMLSDLNGKKTYIGAEDYIIVNKKIANVISIEVGDLDFIRNGFAEAAQLSGQLTSLISSLSSYEMGQISAVSSFLKKDDAFISSVVSGEMSAAISSNADDIEWLSSRISANADDIWYLSGEVSSNADDISWISSQVSSIPSNISYLSGETSTLSTRYNSTFQNRSITIGASDISVDSLVVHDESSSDEYYVTFKYGSLTLVKKT